jgi:hypothetical protein
MIALDRKKEYHIYMIGEDKMALISFRSCSREVLLDTPVSWRNKKKFYYHYVPNEIERGRACSVTISAINKEGMYNSAYIDFIDESTTLPAESICGEYTEKTKGVTVCQSRMESMQRIRFNTEVEVTTPYDGCPWSAPKRGKEFDYQTHVGKCVWGFVETKPPYRKARMTSAGYEDIQVKL